MGESKVGHCMDQNNCFNKKKLMKNKKVFEQRVKCENMELFTWSEECENFSWQIKRAEL